MRFWSGIILGQPCSKANSRRLVTHAKTGRPMFIKSSEALAYEKAVIKQVPVLNPLLEGRLAVHVRIYYASERPDLDPSIILDALQARIYANDRQVREMHLIHDIDRKNPRAVVTVEEIGAPLLEVAA